MISVELQAHFGNDRTIAEAAWVSSTSRSKVVTKTDEQVKKLIIQLAEEGHGVPFEHVVYRFWIKLPIAIDRQLVKTRIASHSGASGRYRTMPNQYLEISEDVFEIINKIDISMFDNYETNCNKANVDYQNAVKQLKEAEKSGIITNPELKRAREFLRGQLPQHNMTETVWTINLRSLANFMRLRLKPNAQPEIQLIAKLMLEEIKKVNNCPTAIEWLEKNDWRI